MITKMQKLLPKGAFTLLICISMLLSVSLGCRRLTDLVQRRDPNDPPPTDATPTTTDGGGASDNSLVKKTNFYITDCFNKYSNNVVRSHNRYAMWVKDMAVGPTGKEQNIYGLYEVTGDGSDCETAVASAKLVDPEMPEIEAAADKYVVALKDVLKNINDVYKYYEQGDYKDDNFAKGKASHPPLIESFKNFKDINTTFAAEVDKLEDQVAQQQLENLKDQPDKRFDYLVTETGVKAKKVKNLLQDKEYEQLTADELNTLISDFETSVEELRKDTSKKSSGGSYARSCDEFTKASKELMRRIRDGKKFTDSEERFNASGAGWMVEGSPGKVIKAYNDMLFQRQFTRF